MQQCDNGMGTCAIQSDVFSAAARSAAVRRLRDMGKGWFENTTKKRKIINFCHRHPEVKVAEVGVEREHVGLRGHACVEVVRGVWAVWGMPGGVHDALRRTVWRYGAPPRVEKLLCTRTSRRCLGDRTEMTDLAAARYLHRPQAGTVHSDHASR